MAHPAGIGSVKPEGWAYKRSPMIVYWELTNACGLACRHCRATAMPDAAEDRQAQPLAGRVFTTRVGTPGVLSHLWQMDA